MSRKGVTHLAIEVEGVAVSYGDGNSVLSQLNLSVQEGERVAIIGPSGCGKTTLLHAIAGLIPYQEGSICIRGNKVSGIDRDVSMIFQHTDLLPWKSCWENGTLGAVLQKEDPALWKERAERLFTSLGVEHLRNKRPTEISGGEQQRVAIIRSLLTNPKVLLMDEPFSSLDELTRESIQDELVRLIQGRTMVIVTHSIEEAVYLADSIYWMDNDSKRLVGSYENQDIRCKGYRSTQNFYQHAYRLRLAMGGESGSFSGDKPFSEKEEGCNEI